MLHRRHLINKRHTASVTVVVSNFDSLNTDLRGEAFLIKVKAMTSMALTLFTHTVGIMMASILSARLPRRREGSDRLSRTFDKLIMKLPENDAVLAARAARFVKAEMTRTGVTYAQLATQLREHGLKETEASVRHKLAQETFVTTFCLEVVAALRAEGVDLTSLGY